LVRIERLTEGSERFDTVGIVSEHGRVRGYQFFLLAGLLGACRRDRGTPQPAADPALADASRTASTGDILFGPERNPLGPDRIRSPGQVAIGEVKGSSGPISNADNADRVVAGMRAGFRACYLRGLVNAPNQRGAFRVRVAMGAEGQVTRVDVEGAKEISDEIVACIVRRVQAASFARPDNGSATLSFSVTLEPARSE